MPMVEENISSVSIHAEHPHNIAAPFHMYERATGYRQLTYVHGADHNDFNCCCGYNDSPESATPS